MSTENWVRRPPAPGWYWYAEHLGRKGHYQRAVPCEVFYANLVLTAKRANAFDSAMRSRTLYVRIWMGSIPARPLGRISKHAKFLPIVSSPDEATSYFATPPHWRRA